MCYYAIMFLSRRSLAIYLFVLKPKRKADINWRAYLLSIIVLLAKNLTLHMLPPPIAERVAEPWVYEVGSIPNRVEGGI